MYKIIFITLGAAMLFTNCESQPSQQPAKSATSTTTAKSTPVLADVNRFESEMKKSNAQVLDVRTPGEWNTGHLSGAVLADISNFESFKKVVATLDPAKPVLVYCAVGGRSKQAATWLSDNGYSTVYDLNGGINAWKSSGKTIIKDN